MSLLDAFLEDGLAASVLAASDVWFAIRKDGAPGSGTQEDPFDGFTAAHFDAAMASLGNRPSPTHLNLTIHLGPTAAGYEFKTAGGTAWQPRSGWRLVGAGIDATVLKVENTATDVDLVAIGNPTSSSDPTPNLFLSGFEVSDLTIDCNVTGTPPANSAVNGIWVTGNHVYLRRLRVKNFGGRRSGICVALSAAWAASGWAPSDCLIEGCQVVGPFLGVTATSKPAALVLRSAAYSSYFHEDCAIRNCYVDGGDTNLNKNTYGIMASGGRGTIVEGNRILNCQDGGPFQDEAIAIEDLVVRDNFYSNVLAALSLILPDDTAVGRVDFLGNWVELAPMGNVRGANLDNQTGSAVSLVILRGNVIRYSSAPSSIPATDYGIWLAGCEHAIVENNIIDVGTADHAVFHGTTDGVKLFNNQTADGAFRAGFNGSTHDQELTTEVEDVLLGLLMR